MLQTVALKEVKDRRLETTIVPPHLPSYKQLGNFLVVVMVKKGEMILSNHDDKVLNPSSVLGSHSWETYRFKAYGNVASENTPDSGDGLAGLSNGFNTPSLSSAHPGLKNVDRWVKQSALSGSSDPFQPNGNNIIAEPLEEPTPQAPLRKRHVKARKPKGIAPDKTDPDDVKSVATHPPSYPSPERRYHGAANSSSGTSESSQSRANRSAASGSRLSRASDSVANQAGVGGANPRPPPIEAPYMPTSSSISHMQMDEATSKPDWNTQPAANCQAGRLIDVSIPNTSVVDSMKPSSDDRRVLRRTMNQKKPTPIDGSINGLAAMHKSLEQATTCILKHLEKSQGSVDFSVEIGRVMVYPQAVPGDFKRKQFSPAEWAHMFPASEPGKQKPIFTNRYESAPDG